MNSNNNKKVDEKEIEDLVNYIDNFMSKSNAGHMKIKLLAK